MNPIRTCSSLESLMVWVVGQMMTKTPLANPSKTKFSFQTSEQIPNISRLRPIRSSSLLLNNLGWSEPKWEEKNPPKFPFFGTFSPKSEPAELFFQEDGEGHTTNPLQETPHWEKRGEKNIWDGISGSAGCNFNTDFWTWWGLVKTWEFKLGVQEGFFGIQGGLKASLHWSNPILIHVFGSVLFQWPEFQWNSLQDPPILPKTAQNWVLIIVFPILSILITNIWSEKGLFMP